jgi:hypothetical protein
LSLLTLLLTMSLLLMGLCPWLLLLLLLLLLCLCRLLLKQSFGDIQHASKNICVFIAIFLTLSLAFHHLGEAVFLLSKLKELIISGTTRLRSQLLPSNRLSIRSSVNRGQREWCRLMRRSWTPWWWVKRAVVADRYNGGAGEALCSGQCSGVASHRGQTEGITPALD